MSEILLALAMFTLVGILCYIMYALFSDKRNAVKHYMSHLYAYKVGLIKKRATENEVELCFPTAEDKFLSQIEENVDEAISSAGE